MRLVVEEAQDHSACMENLRSLYGSDCVVVHSFRVDDLYRVVIALETETRTRVIAPESAVKNVVSNASDRWDTLVDDTASLNTPVATDVISEQQYMQPEALLQGPAEITSGLLELAARIKALESLEPPSVLEPESEDFRQAVFSEVLAEAVAAGDQPQHIQQHNATQEAPQGQEALLAPITASVAIFPAPVDALIKTSQSFISDTLNTSAPIGETPIPRVCTSDSAENFASLLLTCVADSQKSLPLYEQTQLRMGGS